MTEKKKLPGCLPARRVKVELKLKTGGGAERHWVVIPEDWTRSQFLAYVRGVHIHETARILEWRDSSDWVANPRAFANFKTGVLRST